jgi:hypothetical protein
MTGNHHLEFLHQRTKADVVDILILPRPYRWEPQSPQSNKETYPISRRGAIMVLRLRFHMRQI